MTTEDKDATSSKPEETPDKNSSAAAEEIHIPDYVMLDFDFPKGTRISGKLPA
jgi:hypothetical protein